MSILTGIILFLLLIGAMFTIVVIFGQLQIKADYECEYKTLEVCVLNGLIDNHNYREIKDRFTAIRKYECRDDFKLDWLEEIFKQRFKNL